VKTVLSIARFYAVVVLVKSQNVKCGDLVSRERLVSNVYCSFFGVRSSDRY